MKRTPNEVTMVEAKDANQVKSTPSATLHYGLQLLKDDAVNAFRRAFLGKCHEYHDKPEIVIDAFYEVFVERNDMPYITKMLEHWNKYIATLPECQHRQGAIDAIRTLTDLCKDIDAMRPKERGESEGNKENAMTENTQTVKTETTDAPPKIEEQLAAIGTRLSHIEANVDWLVARGCIDEATKIDIVRGLMRIYQEEAAAKKIVTILEALNSEK